MIETKKTDVKTFLNNFKKEFKEKYFKIPELIRLIFWALVIVIPIKLFLISPHMVIGSSMLPSFETNDYLLVSKISTLERGDIIVIKPPENTGFFSDSYIKRLIGLPGDIIRIKDRQLFIKKKGTNEFKKIDEPYVNNHGLMYDNEWKIKNDEYFVMGDNRGGSKDSRFLGPFKVKDTIGEPVMRIFGFRKDKKTDENRHFKFFFDLFPEKQNLNI